MIYIRVVTKYKKKTLNFCYKLNMKTKFEQNKLRCLHKKVKRYFTLLHFNLIL